MDKLLEKQLIDEFPSYFRDAYGDPKKTCMAWCCDVGDGWFQLLYTLCEGIKGIQDDETDFYFLQIKEKFARLTLYWRSQNKNAEIRKLINVAEELSTEVCEVCGTIENVSCNYKEVWIRTLCDKCRKT